MGADWRSGVRQLERGTSSPRPSGFSTFCREMPAQWEMMEGTGMCRCWGNGVTPETPGGGGPALPRWAQWVTDGHFSV